MMQNKLNPGKLLDRQGRLAESGYATALVRQYDRKDIRANRLRIKEWDYYLIYNDDYGLAMTLDDNSYMGLVSVSWLDFRNRTEQTKSLMSVLPLGKTGLPPSSAAGDVGYANAKVDLSFRHADGRRHLTCALNEFTGKEPIRIDINLFAEPADSMVIATPFATNPQAFYYNQKIVGMRAEGTAIVHGETFNFDPACSFGILDWGRGVWTYDNTWYWSAGQGLVNQKVFGFNLGYGFGDTSAATENMLFYDGRAHKLETVTFHIPQTPAGADDYLQPWVFTSPDRRFEMDFQPILDRSALTSLGVLMSDQHQVFGYFTGTAVLDDGTRLDLDHFLGFAEKVRNKW
jgi:hypothetical protein